MTWSHDSFHDILLNFRFSDPRIQDVRVMLYWRFIMDILHQQSIWWVMKLTSTTKIKKLLSKRVKMRVEFFMAKDKFSNRTSTIFSYLVKHILYNFNKTFFRYIILIFAEWSPFDLLWRTIFFDTQSPSMNDLLQPTIFLNDKSALMNDLFWWTIFFDLLFFSQSGSGTSSKSTVSASISSRSSRYNYSVFWKFSHKKNE